MFSVHWWMSMYDMRFILIKRLNVWTGPKLIVQPCNWSRDRELEVVVYGLMFYVCLF
jgi:hypothetical protein